MSATDGYMSAKILCKNLSIYLCPKKSIQSYSLQGRFVLRHFCGADVSTAQYRYVSVSFNHNYESGNYPKHILLCKYLMV